MSYRLGQRFLIDDFGYAVGRTEAIEFAIEILNRYKDISGGEIERASGYPVQMIAYTWAEDAYAKERAIHDHFEDARRIGEWFDFTQHQADFARGWIEGGAA